MTHTGVHMCYDNGESVKWVAIIGNNVLKIVLLVLLESSEIFKSQPIGNSKKIKEGWVWKCGSLKT